MKLLLDTCTFLWIVVDSPQLSTAAREAFQSVENEVFLSSVSAWEIALKHSLGRLPLPEPPETYVPRLRRAHGIDPLPLDEESALHLARLAEEHRDPFDRMLVCQAIIHGMVIATPDAEMRRYPCRFLW